MKTICVAGLKGGIAKTNTAISLAYVAANEFDKKVLLIDNDAQSSSSILLGVTPNNYDKRTPFSNIPEAISKLENEDLSYVEDDLRTSETSDDDYEDELEVDGLHSVLYEMIERGREGNMIPELNKELIDSAIYTPTYKILETAKDDEGKIIRNEEGKVVRETNTYEFGFDLMPSTEFLSDVQLLWDEKNMGRTNWMQRGRQLSMIVDFIDKNYDYDLCIIDNPPSLDLISINGLAAARTGGVIIPVSQDKQSLYSLKRIKRNLRVIIQSNKGHIGCLGVLLTIFNEKRTVDRYISKTVGHDLRLHVFTTTISETNDAKKAVLSGLILPQINERNYKENVRLFKEIEKRQAELSQGQE
ncbi:MAG: AAA family ATPase [Oscillospiraceae bacterium]|nr:AAA family ATPase [Oscillospiraceae bacterium]